MLTQLFSPFQTLRRGTRRMSIPAAVVLLAASASLPAEESALHTRCGWFDNATPGNVTLTDRDGEWTIARQGDREATGPWPEFKPAQWVITNVGQHGHGCACLQVTVDAKKHEIRRIQSAHSKPLAICRKDRTLHEPDNPFD